MLAIRRYPNSSAKMKREILATYYQKISTDKKPQQYCPSGPDSWYKWRRAEPEKTLKEFRHSDPLDNKVQEVLWPIYRSLSFDDLLNRCVGGFTQNNNESFNKTVWQFAPKHINSGAKTINVAAYIAACIFNKGANTLLKILEIMGVKIGPNAKSFAASRDEERIREAERRTQYESREEKIARHNQRIEQEEEFEEIEVILYGPGIVK